jgi:hypothetical protein
MFKIIIFAKMLVGINSDKGYNGDDNSDECDEDSDKSDKNSDSDCGYNVHN